MIILDIWRKKDGEIYHQQELFVDLNINLILFIIVMNQAQWCRYGNSDIMENLFLVLRSIWLHQTNYILDPHLDRKNTLDEVDIIAKEIRESKVLVPHGGFIPKTEWDILLLVTEQLFVDYFNVSDNGIQFRMEDEDELLTLPLHRVRTLTSRMGDVIYPKPIKYKR